MSIRILVGLIVAIVVVALSACGKAAPGTEQGPCLATDGGAGSCEPGLTCAFISCDPGASVPDPCGMTCLDCVHKRVANEQTFCP